MWTGFRFISRLVTAQKVADKAKELGFKLDKVAGCYVAV